MEWIEVTEHAAERWHQRAGSPGVGPIVAWNEAERRQVRTVHGDEVRYHRPSECLLVRRNEALVTVIDIEGATYKVRQDIKGHA